MSLYQAGLTRCKALYFLKVHRGTHPVFLQKEQNKLTEIRYSNRSARLVAVGVQVAFIQLVIDWINAASLDD